MKTPGKGASQRLWMFCAEPTHSLGGRQSTSPRRKDSASIDLDKESISQNVPCVSNIGKGCKGNKWGNWWLFYFCLVLGSILALYSGITPTGVQGTNRGVKDRI